MSEQGKILAIDPGTLKSASIIYDSGTRDVEAPQMLPNAQLLEYISNLKGVKHMAVEMMASMGSPVGQTTFETAAWIGRFIQAWLNIAPTHTYELVYRLDEKLYICDTTRAKDPNISQALMDRYGSDRKIAVGTKNNPGPLYGVSKDVWSALAVAVVAAELPEKDRRGKGKRIL